jgi:prevent-host-death family protein
MTIEMTILGHAMSDVSIAEAKSQLAHWVHEAEAGRPVQITRRGKPVAVLVSVPAFRRSHRTAKSFTAFLKTWRDEAQLAGIDLADDDTFKGVRAPSHRSPIDLG